MREKKEICLTMDIVFKIFFKTEVKYLALILSNILNEDIQDEGIIFLDKEEEGDTTYDKVCVLDLKVKLSSGELVYIEMQSSKEEHLHERMEYYVSRTISKQLQKGEGYGGIKKVYGIFFLNYKNDEFNQLFTTIKEYANIKGKEVKRLREKHIINLRHLENNTIFGKDMMNFLKFMTLSKERDRKKMAISDERLKEAYEAMEKINSDPIVEEFIWAKENEERQKNDQINAAKKIAMEEGHAKGHAEGKLEEKKNIARNMKLNNCDINLIIVATGLTEKEINEL